MADRRSRFVTAVLFLLVACTVTACETSDGRSADSGWAPTPTMDDLAGTAWVAHRIEDPDHELVADTQVDLSFTDTSVSLRAGCNTMFGEASIDGTELVVPTLASTRMGCEPDLMAQDVWLDTFLSSRPRIERQDDDLWLSRDDTVLHLARTGG